MPTRKRDQATSRGGGQVTRRSVLKQLTVLGTAVAGGAAVGLILPRDAAATLTEPYDWTRHRWVYLIDTRKCIGCGFCVGACRQENEVPHGNYRTWIERYRINSEGEAHVDSPLGGERGFERIRDSGHFGKAFFVPKLCNQCAASPCSQVCPVGASYSTRDGVVLVDAEHCIGCGYCVQACPYGSRFMNHDTHTADKCTWCYHRLTRGETTACVGICPTGARIIGDREDPDDPINHILATERIQVLQPELLTKPQCYYQGLDQGVR